MGATPAQAYCQAAAINAAAYTQVNNPRQIAEVILSGLIGTYSIIRQHDIQRDYLRLAEEQVDQAERYLNLAEDNYNDIAVVSFDCQKSLFTRYTTSFAGRELEFLTCAFDRKDYTADFETQKGRALGDVSAAFGRARQQRRRNTGKYNSGRACHDNTQLAIAQARAETAAANNAYRFEEQRKFRYDQWYFQRMTAGISMVSDMASRVVSGVNGGTAGVNSALAGVGSALSVGNQAFGFVENGFTNQANFFGSIANAAFSNGMQAFGRLDANVALGGIGLPGNIQTSGVSGALGFPAAAGSTVFAQTNLPVREPGLVGGLGHVGQHGDGHSVHDMSHIGTPDPAILFAGERG